MIKSINGDDPAITADRAARELVCCYGGQLDGMDSAEWDNVVRVDLLTEKEILKISTAIGKHSARVRRFLRLDI